jgi:hypothetical protein
MEILINQQTSFVFVTLNCLMQNLDQDRWPPDYEREEGRPKLRLEL